MSTGSQEAVDVVVYGATSFVGKLICEYYLRNYGASPPGFKWAIAGRSEDKLKAVKNQLAGEVDSSASTLRHIVADAMDGKAIDKMVVQTKVVVTTVGPYQRYGNKLVEACVKAGVHYCDLTGESLWVQNVIEKYHSQAGRTGAKIVHSCGFDSIPADLGAFMMVEHMKRKHNRVPDDVRYYFGKSSGGMSGGTAASIYDVVEELWQGGSESRKKMADPTLLTLNTPTPPEEFSRPGGLGYDSVAKSWTAPSVFAGHDSKIVYRSAGLLDYGKTFRYKEVIQFKGLVKGLIPALLTSFILTIGGLLLLLPPTRAVMSKFLPEPGQGPSKEKRDNGFFWINYLARSTQSGQEITCCGRVGSDKGDPGYKETAKMQAECALCLVLDEARLESKKGGVLTTASAMGKPLLERLTKAGMTFEVLDK